MAENQTGTNGLGPNEPPFTDILKQLNFSSQDEILKKETGLKVADKIYSEQMGYKDNLNFFAARALRWINIMKWATGTQDMTQFLDFFNVSDGNKAYVKIDMTPIMVGPQFVATLVESMAKNEMYPCVSAVDDDSQKEKQEREWDALYRMHAVQDIDQMQQASGMTLEPPNAYVPDNELMARVYFELEDRLPKEIRFEKLLEGTLIRNQYDRVLKRQNLYDYVVFNMGATKIEKEGRGEYCIRRCIKTNMFYNCFMGETGKYELSYIGEAYNLKAKDIRMKFGLSAANPKGLTEKEIYELVKLSSQNGTGIGFNYQWQETYNLYNYNCPWDDYSIYVIDFEINVNLSDYYVGKVDNYGKENITEKKSKPDPKSDKASVYKKNKNRWYRGVYAPFAKKMLYWGLPDIIVLPYTDTRVSLSSYSINIPFNNGQYIPSLFERAMEPLKEYALAKLKRKQLIAKLRPSGIRIDVESARNIDLGTGNTIPWEEVVRIFDQTGNELWSSRGLNPNDREHPAISNTANDDAVQKILNLTEVMRSSLMEIRELLGVPIYRDGSDVGDRTAAKLAEGQNQSSFNVTDFIPNAENELMEETLHKVCLLQWQDIVTDEAEGDEDLINTRFKVDVRMKQTLYEKQLLEQNINKWSSTIDGNGKPLLSPKDVFRLRNIKNYKLAELMLANIVEENDRKAEADKSKREQVTFQAQQQSAMQAKQMEDKMQQDKLAMDKEMEEARSKNKKQEIALQGILELYKVVATPKSGGEGGVGIPKQPMIPLEIQQLAQMTFENVGLAFYQNTTNTEKDMQAKEQAEQEEQQAAMEQQMMEQEQGAQQEQMQPMQ